MSIWVERWQRVLFCVIGDTVPIHKKAFSAGKTKNSCKSPMVHNIRESNGRNRDD